jgi:MFS family permease
LNRRTSFYALLTATVVDGLGSRMSMVAVPWLILVTTGSATQMGLVVVATMVPYLLAGIFGTPITDRLGMRTAAIVSELVSMCTTGVIAASPHIGTILGMVAISGTVQGVGTRARHVLLRPAAEQAGLRMRRVTAVYDGLGSATTLLGSPLAGLMVFWLGPQGAIWIDAASYLIAGVVLWALVNPPMESALDGGEKKEPYLVALRAGARQLTRDHLLFGMLVMAFFANMVNQAHTAVFVPLWVSQVLHSPAALGTVFGAFAAGGLIGNLTFTALAPKLPQYVTYTIALAISGAPRLLVLGLSHNLAMVLAVTFVCGLAVAAVNPILGAILYERVPPELQNRVFGLVASVTFAGYPVGGLLGGWAVVALGLNPAILLGSAVYVVATMIPLLRYRSSQPVSPESEPAPEAEAEQRETGPARS